MTYEYFDDLVHSVATSRMLLQRAHETGALIEGLCLYVSVVDALLRLGIVHTRTQKAPDHRYEVPKALIRQDEGERTYSERNIYRQALQEGVVTPELYEKLQEMYEYRNKVVHRFNISGIKYAEIGPACVAFEEIYREVLRIIDILENGPHGPRPRVGTEKEESRKKLLRKIGSNPDPSI